MAPTLQVQLQLPVPAIDMSVKDVASSGLKEIPGQFRASWHVKRASANNSNGQSIPIIDLAGLHGGNRSLIIEQIKTASEEWGFFQVCHELLVIYFLLRISLPYHYILAYVFTYYKEMGISNTRFH
jgi:hypothetical protein